MGKKIIQFGFIFAGYVFFNSCSQDMDPLLQEDVNADRSVLRSSVTIVLCKDAYVDVGEYSEYKGTYCWKETVDLGNDFELPPGEYIPDGYPQSGGGGSFDSGSSWHFNFHLLEKVYGRSSKLNLLEKDALQNAISCYSDQPEQYLAAYNRMLSSNVKVDFMIDSTIPNPAQYRTGDQTVRFQSKGAIVWMNVAEEFLHALQHQVYYGDKMSAEYKNYEFEAHVFRDLAFGIANKLALNDPSKPYYYGGYNCFDMDNPHYEEYDDWLKKLINYGYFPIGERANLNKFCSYWDNVPGETLSDFYPQLLRIFFDKPQKP